MDLTTAFFGGALLTVFTAIQVWINSGKFKRIDAELTAIRSDIAALRSDLLHVALDRRRDG